MLKWLLLWVIALLCTTAGTAQYALSPLNPVHGALFSAWQAREGRNICSGFAPFPLDAALLDSICDADTRKWQRRDHKSWIMRKLRNEHLIYVNQPSFTLRGDVVLNLEAGVDRTEAPARRLYTNTRGYQFSGTIGRGLFFNTSFYESQSVFPDYMDTLVAGRKGVPGYGRSKDFNTSTNYDYDYASATGTVGYAFRENTFIQFGHDRQFVGYGYRSVLLSDASAPYPFFRAQVGLWKNRITYTTTWAVLQTLNRVPVDYPGKEEMFMRLGAKFNYLHIQPWNWIGVGVFDGTTWTWRNNNHPSNIEYYMPYGGVYSADAGILNELWGFSAFVRPLKWTLFYGQAAFNDGASGWQAGLKLQSLIPSLVVQLEYNDIGQDLYGKFIPADSNMAVDPANNPTRFYQHNGQWLGHSSGQGLSETLLKIQYRFRDLFASVSIHHFSMQETTATRHISYLNAEGGYIINPKSNTQVVLGVIDRQETALETRYLYFALRTNLINRYLDF